MGFKKMDRTPDFADFALASSLKHNRSLKLMETIDQSIDWARIEQVLLSHYTVRTSGEGADAYSPLLLFKCLLLQKWFRINSDPESKNRSNYIYPSPLRPYQCFKTLTVNPARIHDEFCVGFDQVVVKCGVIRGDQQTIEALNGLGI